MIKYVIRLLPWIVLTAFLVFTPGCGSGSGDSGNSDNNDNPDNPDNNSVSSSYSADHKTARLSILQSIHDSAITDTKEKLHIAYGHTSHGSQIVDGVNGLIAFMNGISSTTDLYDGLDLGTDMGNYGSTYGASDLNQPDYSAWETATRNYLSSHTGINVVIWSWCAGVSHAGESDIENYLSLMSGLEEDYPDIAFIYMTGHLDGTGEDGNLHKRNEQIRKYCRDNDKWLFDFADIESYDPDGNYYLDKNADDGCNYTGGNWATAWQGSHTENVDWYSCSSAHSQPLNANMKAYAFWWLMARVAGWED